MIVVRPMRREDAAAVAAVEEAAFADSPDLWTMGERDFERQVARWPEGQLVAVDDATGDVVGSASSLRVRREDAFARHDWWRLVGGTSFSRHDPAGDVLYGAEATVHPAWQGQGVGRALYRARLDLVERDGLLGFATGGRIPGYAPHAAEGVPPEAYVRLVEEGRARDPVLSFHLAMGAVVLDVMPDYLDDERSRDHAALVFLPNPLRADARALARTARRLPWPPPPRA